MEAKPCILCELTHNDSHGETVQVTRGLQKIECSTSKGDNVQEQLKNKKTVVVHVKCRKDYTRRLEPMSKKTQSHPSHVSP